MINFCVLVASILILFSSDQKNQNYQYVTFLVACYITLLLKLNLQSAMFYVQQAFY